jgi:signal transduction histidine kinase
MAMAIETIRAVQNDIHCRIDALSHALPHCAIDQLAGRIDEIRRLAHDNGFATVECLAATLASAVARGGRQATILCYLDAMSDANGLPPQVQQGAAQEALLASVALRLHN